MAYGYTGGIHEADTGALSHQHKPDEKKHRYGHTDKDLYKSSQIQKISLILSFVSIRKTTKEKLDDNEMERIINLELEEGSLIWHCKNYFLFSYYCAGIRAADLIQLRWGNVTNSGRLQAEYASYVTQADKDRMRPELRHKMYQDVSSKNALINKYLKKIAEQAEIEKSLSLCTSVVTPSHI